jgi:predicted NACHT family NTPase
MPSFHAFERMCSTGRVLLVLDGFDEMMASSSQREVVDCLKQVFILAGLNAKTILTCRSNFFSSNADIINLLKNISIDVPLIESNSTIRIAFEGHGRIITMQPWDLQRVEEFIRAKTGAEADGVLSSINSIHDLSDLSSRPVLLDMIVKTLPELRNSNSPVNSATLYERYTAKWTARDNWRVSSDVQLRQVFCESLAELMNRADVSTIRFALLKKIMDQSLSQIAGSTERLEELESDIQTCSFLFVPMTMCSASHTNPSSSSS